MRCAKQWIGKSDSNGEMFSRSSVSIPHVRIHNKVNPPEPVPERSRSTVRCCVQRRPFVRHFLFRHQCSCSCVPRDYVDIRPRVIQILAVGMLVGSGNDAVTGSMVTVMKL